MEKEQSILRTKERRPDLYARYVRLQECRQLLMKQKLLHIDMIELINRGRAQLLYFGQGQILLKDMEYEIYFHACVDPSRLPDIRTWTLPVEKIPLAVLHQEEMIPYFKRDTDLIRSANVIRLCTPDMKSFRCAGYTGRI